MKTFRLMTTMVLVVGLIAVFSASGAQAAKGQQEKPVKETQESQDQQKAPASGSTSIKAPAASAKSQPLAIKQLYLKEGTVHVVLATTGSAKVGAGDYAQVKLTVEMTGLKKPGEWTLLQVDPKRRLTRPRGTVDFDTGLEVKAGKEEKLAKQVKVGTQVKATLSFGLWKTTKQETLSPMTATAAVKTPVAAVEQNKGTTHRRVSASRLPIEILTPHRGRIFRRGQTMHIRYRIITPTDAGEVTFRLLSTTHGEVATTTHHYEPPDLSGVDWSEAELEPVGTGLLGTSEPDDGEPLGIGDVVLTWTLPSGDSLPYGDDYYLRAHKGGLQGNSATFKIVPPVSLYSGTGIAVDVLGTGLTPGSDLVVRYNCWGCDCERVNPPTGTRINLHRETDSMGRWYVVGAARSGGERTETLHIPEEITPAHDYVITLWGGSGCWGESNSFPILASSTETDFRVIRPNGGEGWQRGTTQRIRWSVANLFGAGSSGEPDARYAIELLRDGAPVEDIPTSGIAYDSATRTCSVPWEIPPTLSYGTRYKVRIQATNRAEPGGAPLTAESAENFTICDDCMVEDLTSRTDLWIECVEIGGNDGTCEDNKIVDYYTDRGSTSLLVAVRVRWNGERPLPMCHPVVRIYRSDRGYSSMGDCCTAREYDVSGDIVHTGITLPPGLTPGSTIPLRAEIVCGHEEIDARSRSHLDICECCTGNNHYDFSVTLRDAGSR